MHETAFCKLANRPIMKCLRLHILTEVQVHPQDTHGYKQLVINLKRHVLAELDPISLDSAFQVHEHCTRMAALFRIRKSSCHPQLSKYFHNGLNRRDKHRLHVAEGNGTPLRL